MTTLQKQKLIFNDPGVYNLLYAEKTTLTPEVRIQARLERFPDRSVDFSRFSIHFIISQPNSKQIYSSDSNNLFTIRCIFEDYCFM
ncbi:unnamed protein product [Anisakis simplex]|uniref:Uncharacterized protein n=1 Tax=Anisakis simplex TaxID=6269 RepID=A0A0M3JLZ3_ANISI|nr:unnamed protein product [Anisakis simplex]